MQNPDENIPIFFHCLAIIIVCIGIFFIVEYIGLLLYGTFEGIPIDNEISRFYDNEIKPNAQLKISEIVNSANNQDNDIGKLYTISEWTSYFTYPNESFQLQDRFYQFSIIPLAPDSHYLKDSEGRWIIRRGKYTQDLMIIAYYECGRCGEIAKIWNHTANLTGFVTRQVSDPSGYHAWVEVKQSDEWYYLDPTIHPSDNLVLWFNSTKNRNQSPLLQKVARVMTSDNQDITHYYPPYGTVKINNFGHYDAVFARWDDETGKTFDEPYDIRYKSSVEINLSVKNYTFYTSDLSIFSKKIEISVEEGKIVEVDLFEELKPSRLQMGRMSVPQIEEIPKRFKLIW